MFKKLSAAALAACMLLMTASGCGQSGESAAEETTAPAETKPAAVTKLPKPDMTKWLYREDEDVYYRVGLTYCEKPVEKGYEQLALFVPGAYMDATDNGDGTFTCTLNESAELNGYTAATAPIVMPLYTPGYAAADPLTEEMVQGFIMTGEEGVQNFTSQGFVYAYPGCRGINEGAPAGVADLKAAVRYIRYCDDVIAGDAESIFVFGMSGGGAQAAVLGASGDSPSYDPYLKAIGAVQGVSDAVAGSMDWCPITSLNTADAEYEWMLGCTRPERSEEEQAISDELALAYADYVNSAGFKDKDGNALTLTESAEGIYQAGSYYDYIKGVIETSLDHYLADTEFTDGTAEDYINSLNADKKWVAYDKSTNTATVTSVADFAENCKPASSMLVAFDQPAGQNTLFGLGDGKGSHFDRILSDIVTKLKMPYADDYISDLAKTDFVGNNVEKRVLMYAPLYFLMEGQKGYGTAKVAPYWRIRTGIAQPTTSLTTEVNLALALEQYDGVRSVDFETVWAQTHEPAERTGDSTANFIAWVNDCMKG